MSELDYPLASRLPPRPEVVRCAVCDVHVHGTRALWLGSAPSGVHPQYGTLYADAWSCDDHHEEGRALVELRRNRDPFGTALEQILENAECSLAKRVFGIEEP